MSADSVVKDRMGKERAMNCWCRLGGVWGGCKYEPDIDGEVKHNEGASAA